MSKHQHQPGRWRMSWLTRDRTADPVSRDQFLKRERGLPFPCSADNKQDWQPYHVMLSLPNLMTIHDILFQYERRSTTENTPRCPFEQIQIHGNMNYVTITEILEHFGNLHPHIDKVLSNIESYVNNVRLTQRHSHLNLVAFIRVARRVGHGSAPVAEVLLPLSDVGGNAARAHTVTLHSMPVPLAVLP